MNTAKLPIEAIKTEFISALTTKNTLVLSAPPGAGKSTCLPLWLLALPQFSGQKIYLLQPRRVAVKNIALYLASQLGEQVGERVGYRLRDETKVSSKTQLEVITEGILTKIMQNDAELDGCALVIFDEFHERSMQGDLAFALARDIQLGLRDDLKILLMSATLDNEFLAKKLPDAVLLKSAGRSYPIEISYDPPINTQRWREHALKVITTQARQQQGSILVFLAGIADIRFLAERLASAGILPDNVDLHCLYGDLSLKAQQQVIAPSPSGRHRLVLSTNIAETSLTIDGINCVIDCGFEKRAVYDSASLTNKLVQQQISKASAIQRAGRAGRLMAGTCIRLYAKEDFERRQGQAISEIQQTDLLPLLIESARWGVSQLVDLPLLELPNNNKENQAWQELQRLDIVNNKLKLTVHGKQVAKLSCHPRFAQMILRANSLAMMIAKPLLTKQYTSLACILAAMLAERDIFSRQQGSQQKGTAHKDSVHKGNGQNSDIRQRLTVLLDNPQNHTRIYQQAQRLARQANIHFVKQAKLLPVDNIGMLLALAYPERVAKLRATNKQTQGHDYLCANGKGVCLAEGDSLAGQALIVVADLQQTRNHTLTVRLAASIEQIQLETIFSKQITTKDSLTYNESNGKISARKQTKLFALLLSQTSHNEKLGTEKLSNKKIGNKQLSTEKIASMWCELVQKKGLAWLNWQAKDLALKTRWQWLNTFVSDADFPLLSEDFLLANLTTWFAPFVGEVKNKAQLDKINLSNCILSLLDYNQQQLLAKLAPEYYLGPTGRRCPITYHHEQLSPKVSLPMQEVYGLAITPQVGEVQIGKGISLLLELLSPAGRPIQVTQNLAQFWQGSYAEVKKEMKSHYPKLRCTFGC
ncbi:MAG: ATP-dependent helicase HrpB [Alteromonadaceae bacterium]|nr:ATP-dependent helicase HrpB [Alteromonadaceae bacterium]